MEVEVVTLEFKSRRIQSLIINGSGIDITEDRSLLQLNRDIEGAMYTMFEYKCLLISKSIGATFKITYLNCFDEFKTYIENKCTSNINSAFDDFLIKSK